MKFGKDSMGTEWTAANEFTDRNTYELLSQKEIDTLKDFDFIDFEVHSLSYSITLFGVGLLIPKLFYCMIILKVCKATVFYLLDYLTF